MARYNLNTGTIIRSKTKRFEEIRDFQIKVPCVKNNEEIIWYI